MDSIKVYLCTENRIIAHADVDMSLLLPVNRWEGRNAIEFGRTGMQGDFQLRRPGESLSQEDLLDIDATSGGKRPRASDEAVVTICAQLTRADLSRGDNSSIWSDGSGDVSAGPRGAEADGRASDLRTEPGRQDNERVVAGVRTWTHPAPKHSVDGAQETGAGVDSNHRRHVEGSAFSGSSFSENEEKCEMAQDEIKRPQSSGRLKKVDVGTGVTQVEHCEGWGARGGEAQEGFPLEGGVRDCVGGKGPRSYRLSVNLASVKDLDIAAYVVSALPALGVGVCLYLSVYFFLFFCDCCFFQLLSWVNTNSITPRFLRHGRLEDFLLGTCWICMPLVVYSKAKCCFGF